MTKRGIVHGTILLLAVLSLLAATGCRKEVEKAKPKATPTPAARDADFQVGEVSGVNPSGKPEAAQRANEEAPKAIALLNEFYGSAFIDKNSWDAGKHPKLAGLFIAEAQPAIAANLGALALGELAPKVTSVTPTKQQAGKISFFVEDDLSAPAGAVTASFEATAKTAEKSDGPLALVHTASFWLVREGDGYKIYAYSVELKADTAVKSAAFGSPSGPGSAI